MKKLLTEKRILVTLGILIILAFGFSLFTAIRSFTLSPGEQVVTSGGITVTKPTNNITDAKLRDDGILIVQYEDGTTREVGYIVGPRGESGQSIAPSEAQIAAAVVAYCTTNNRCDAKAPSAEQVATAVSNYCSGRNNCVGATGSTGATGATGADGQNATTEQVMAAVQQYCANGRCTGPQGVQGVAGTNGQDPVMSCVIRQASGGINRQYVAWKYSTEADSLYRNLYLLPTWAQGENCIDLTA